MKFKSNEPQNKYGCIVTLLLLLSIVLVIPVLSACEETSDSVSSHAGDELTPLIFVPGITGSTLVSLDDAAVLWPPGGLDNNVELSNINDDFWRLSLNPQTGPHEDICTNDVIRDYGEEIIYSDFLNFLKEEGGYIEYEVDGKPSRRTLDGAFTGQEPKPSLFVFAYDWRLPIEENSELLSEYVKVVSDFYPDEKVNVVTHSMGGLVARRYILDHPNKVNKLITVAAPFLGSAKPLYQMIYGKLNAPVYYGTDAFKAGAVEYYTGDAVRDMLAYYPGLHELMSSRGYFALGGPPYTVVETISEAVEELKIPETREVSYTELMGAGGIVDQLFPDPSLNGKTPAQSNHDFHAYTANGNNQDDWSQDTTGVKYYHLIGVQSTNDTPLSIREATGYTAAQERDYALDLYGPGDGTVPRISAERKGNGFNYNAPDARLYVFTDGPDIFLEHTGLMQNPDVLYKILDILQEEVEPRGERWVLSETVNTAETETEVYSDITEYKEGHIIALVDPTVGSMYINRNGKSFDMNSGEETYSYDESGKVFFSVPPPDLVPGDMIDLTVSRGDGTWFLGYYFIVYDPEVTRTQLNKDDERMINWLALTSEKTIALKYFETSQTPSETLSFIVPELHKGEMRIRLCPRGYQDQIYIEWIYKAADD